MRNGTNLRSPVPLPVSNAATADASCGALGDASPADLRRGFTPVADDDAGQFDMTAYPGRGRDPSPSTRPWLGNPDSIDNERDDR